MVAALAQGEPIEIAGLLGNSHDKVMQSIDHLAVREVIALPPLGDRPTPSGQYAMVYVSKGEQDTQTSSSPHMEFTKSQALEDIS